MSDGAAFCASCGASQADGGAVSQGGGYIAPNFEFKTVRCYPSDATESKYKYFYEGCGWIIMDMDRKQVYTGQSADGTRHYSTQTHIKMQRDKNRPNYDKIYELSAKAESYFDTTPAAYSYGKGTKSAFIALLAMGIVFLILGLFAGFVFSFGGGFSPMGIAFVVVGAVSAVTGIIIKAATHKKISAKKAELMASYNQNKAEADKAFEECRRLVNGAYNG
jgi:hypothetical protein